MNKLLRPLTFILIFLIALQFFNKPQDQGVQDDLSISGNSKITIGKEVTVRIKNNSDTEIVIPNACPNNPLLVEKYINGEWIERKANISQKECLNNPIQKTISPNNTYVLGFHNWNWGLFNEIGKYRISLETNINNKEKKYVHEIQIVEPGLLKKIWSRFFYKPIFNILILLISKIPGYNLGWGIIILTILIKLILLGPNHKALKAQKQMQKVQPQLDALKIKYKDEPQKLASETMAIWKKYKVSPMSSCMPMLIQFPILIALFYVIKNGLNFVNPTIVYSSLQGFNLNNINTEFLGIIDLSEVNVIVLPLIVGSLQFFQMKLTLGKAKTNKPVVKDDASNPMGGMQKMMIYFMPIMIAVFTASVPAAVGFYWGTSTLFGIGQQIVVNKSKD